MTADERSLIQAIIANPEDDLPRLVYADWLEEHGRAERAEFIRLWLAFAKLRVAVPADLARYQEIGARLRELNPRWDTEWGPAALHGHPTGRRTVLLPAHGLPGILRCSATYLARSGISILHAHPIRTVQLLRPRAGPVGRLAQSPAPDLVRGWQIDVGGDFGTDLADAVLALVGRRPVRLLDLSTRSVEYHSVFLEEARSAWAARLAASPAIANVERLDLSGQFIGDAGARALAESPHLGRLRYLNLMHNPLDDGIAAALRARFGDRLVLTAAEIQRLPLDTFL